LHFGGILVVADFRRFCRSADFADPPILPTKFDGSADRIPTDRKICRRRPKNADFADPKLPPCYYYYFMIIIFIIKKNYFKLRKKLFLGNSAQQLSSAFSEGLPA
jgi:hypothetical protein